MRANVFEWSMMLWHGIILRERLEAMIRANESFDNRGRIV